MALRISGVVIPNEKRVEAALCYLYGIGLTLSKKILEQTKIDPNIRVKDLKEEEANRLRTYIEKTLRIEGDLKRDVANNIKRLKDIGSYRGTRHAKKLPARGQRSKTNNRTIRGNVRRTTGSGRKPTGQKT